MIINNAPQNEAVLSNCGAIGEFRIRNSSKAFSILSSGLYANKIRAIVRELSCNAVDSHVAASKADTPFDVHLPNRLEPWFAIRDYGTGLNADQVANIYTTYFESTKTNSNAFIGALGLGSKSPFSYTDNFTITAIKDGIKGIYSAFINEQGVPSIASMDSEASDELNGVEIKFSVNDQDDFHKFVNEAQYVYTYFKLRPTVSGCSDFAVREIQYEKKDILPGVSTIKNHDGRSVAVMGNIPYPIEVPNEQTNLGAIAQLLCFGLELRFEIGEVDFQASREGLSYIPQTINAIKAKLEQLNAALAIVVAEEGDSIENRWDRAEWGRKKLQPGMWAIPTAKYLIDTNFGLVKYSPGSGIAEVHTFKLPIARLAKKYNISISAFQKFNVYRECTELHVQRNHNLNQITEEWRIRVSDNAFFIVNDTRAGALSRAKHHWKVAQPKTEQNHNTYGSHNVYVMSAADPTLPMKTKAFFRLIRGPRADHIMPASTLAVKERKKGSVMGKDVSILSLQNRNNTYRDTEMVWRNAGKADKFDPKQTYYYLPLKGFCVENVGIHESPIYDAKEFHSNVSDCGIGLSGFTLYGVRKADIEFIKTQKNWVNVQAHVAEIFGKATKNFMVGCIAKEVDLNDMTRYNDKVAKLIDAKSPYAKFVNRTKKDPGGRVRRAAFKDICKDYCPQFKYEELEAEFQVESTAIQQRYKLLGQLNTNYKMDVDAVAEYINLIDSK